jgi:hypothetical protein
MSKTGADLLATDAALVHKITQRDEAALAALYDRYAGMLSSVLNRILRDTQAAEEILQDIFYQLWCDASRFDPARGSLPGWLLSSPATALSPDYAATIRQREKKSSRTRC